MCVLALLAINVLLTSQSFTTSHYLYKYKVYNRLELVFHRHTSTQDLYPMNAVVDPNQQAKGLGGSSTMTNSKQQQQKQQQEDDQDLLDALNQQDEADQDATQWSSERVRKWLVQVGLEELYGERVMRSTMTCLCKSVYILAVHKLCCFFPSLSHFVTNSIFFFALNAHRFVPEALGRWASAAAYRRELCPRELGCGTCPTEAQACPSG